MTKNLYKTTIVIWSDEDPANRSLVRLAEEATDGGAYCSVENTVFVMDPDLDPDWDGTEFFDSGEIDD